MADGGVERFVQTNPLEPPAFAQAVNRFFAEQVAAARRQGYQDAIDLLRSRCEDFSDAAVDLLAAALTEGKDSA